MQLAVAVDAVHQVLRDVGGIFGEQFVVQVLLEFGLGLVATAVGHFFCPFAEMVSPRVVA